MRALLVGNYGAGNVGDEALKDYFLSHSSTVEWTVLQTRPKAGDYTLLPIGIRSFFSFAWLKTFGAFRRTDIVVFGGGTLFTDAESLQACVLWWLHVLVARLYRKKVALAFQGVGPFKTILGRMLARWSFRHAAFISVRDEESMTRCHELFKINNIVQTADPIFLTIQKSDSIRTKKVFIVIPRHTSDTKFCSTFAQMSKDVSYDQVRFISMQPEDPREQQVIAELRELCDVPYTVIPLRSMDQLIQELSEATHVLTQRYHGAIPALCVGVPVTIVPKDEGDKLWALNMLLEQGKAEEEVGHKKALALEGERALQSWFAAF